MRVMTLGAVLLDSLVLKLHLGDLRLHLDVTGEAQIATGRDQQLWLLRRVSLVTRQTCARRDGTMHRALVLHLVDVTELAIVGDRLSTKRLGGGTAMRIVALQTVAFLQWSMHERVIMRLDL